MTAGRQSELVLIPIVFALLCSAARPEMLHARQPDSTRAVHVSLLPIIFSSPDTGFGFGALPQVLFGRNDQRRTSVIRADLFRTSKEQTHLSLTSRIWTAGNAYGIRASVRYRDWPSTFHGLTNTLSENSGLSVYERKARVDVEIIRRFNRVMYVGTGVEFRDFRVEDDDEREEPPRSLPLTRVRIAGLRLILALDNRNEVVFPTRGGLVRLECRVHPNLGEDFFGFATGKVAVRSYHALSSRMVLAMEGVVNVSTRSTPYPVMPGVGNVVRGVSSTRLRHRNLLAAQIELRVTPIFRRLGMAFFLGTGRVAGTVPGLFNPGFHPAVGAGLRVMIVSSERLQIRWDVGIGRGTSGDYLDLGEAF